MAPSSSCIPEAKSVVVVKENSLIAKMSDAMRVSLLSFWEIFRFVENKKIFSTIRMSHRKQSRFRNRELLVILDRRRLECIGFFNRKTILIFSMVSYVSLVLSEKALSF